MAPIDDIRKIITDAIIDALKDREDELKRIAEAGGAKAGSGLLGDVGSLSNLIGIALEIGLLLDPPAELALQAVKQAESEGGHLGRGFGLGYILGTVGWQVMQPALLPLQYKVATVFQTQQLDADLVATMVAKSILSEHDGRNKAHDTNIADNDFALMVDAAQERPDIGQLNEMLNRGLISEELWTKAAQRHGIPGDWHGPLQALRKLLLSPADLALATLRGNISQQEALDYIKLLGVDEFDFGVLTENTGEPPGPVEMREAKRRGFIDKARFDRGIRQSRIRNEWIDIEEALSVEPMTVSDSVRAVIEGYITEDEGRTIAFHNGLQEDHYHILVEAYGRPLSHEQMMELFHRGQATEAEVRQAFRESDLKNKYIDQAIELGRTLIAERQIVSAIDHGVLNHDEGVALLKQRGYNESDADTLVRLGQAQRTTTHKTLTKSEILTMYSDALMNRTQATEHLKGIGYQQADITQMLDLADFKRKQQSLKVIERGIEAMYKNHHLSENEALSQLTNAGLDHAQAQQLVDEWTTLRKTATRTLTEAQILKATDELIITPDEARIRLQALGLANADIDILFKIHGYVRYTNAWEFPTGTPPPGTSGVPPTAAP